MILTAGVIKIEKIALVLPIAYGQKIKTMIKLLKHLNLIEQTNPLQIDPSPMTQADFNLLGKILNTVTIPA